MRDGKNPRPYLWLNGRPKNMRILRIRFRKDPQDFLSANLRTAESKPVAPRLKERTRNRQMRASCNPEHMFPERPYVDLGVDWYLHKWTSK